MKRKKLPSLPSLKKKLWKIFSEYIRRRDADEFGWVKCFTCQKRGYWKEFQAGHYIPQSIALALVFDERNVQVQEGGCNLFRNGNPTVYAVELRKKYGDGILEELQSLRRENFKYYRSDYEEMIQTYTEKLASL